MNLDQTLRLKEHFGFKSFGWTKEGTKDLMCFMFVKKMYCIGVNSYTYCLSVFTDDNGINEIIHLLYNKTPDDRDSQKMCTCAFHDAIKYIIETNHLDYEYDLLINQGEKR